MKGTRAPNILKFISLLAFIALLGACGGEGSYVPDPSVLPDDTAQPLAYPAGPYGTIVGSVIKDNTFPVAVFDPGYLCKASYEHNLAYSQGPGTISMLDLYRGGAWCPDKPARLAWFSITTGT